MSDKKSEELKIKYNDVEDATGNGTLNEIIMGSKGKLASVFATAQLDLENVAFANSRLAAIGSGEYEIIEMGGGHTTEDGGHVLGNIGDYETDDQQNMRLRGERNMLCPMMNMRQTINENMRLRGEMTTPLLPSSLWLILRT